MWYIYTMEYYSAIKKKETGSFVETWMDLESVIQSEVSQKEKNKYHTLIHICAVQNGTDEHICRGGIETQTENEHVDMGFKGVGMNWEIGIDIYTLPCVKLIASGNLLHMQETKLVALW